MMQEKEPTTEAECKSSAMVIGSLDRATKLIAKLEAMTLSKDARIDDLEAALKAINDVNKVLSIHELIVDALEKDHTTDPPISAVLKSVKDIENLDLHER